NASGMHGEPELLVDPSGQLSCLTGGVCLTRLVEEVHDVIGEFMGALGAALFRHESLEALLAKLFLQCIEVAPGEAKVFGRLRHATGIFFDEQQHLVLHLEGVIRVKKGMGLEQTIMYFFRSRVESPRGCQFLSFPMQSRSLLLQADCSRDDEIENMPSTK